MDFGLGVNYLNQPNMRRILGDVEPIEGSDGHCFGNWGRVGPVGGARTIRICMRRDGKNLNAEKNHSKGASENDKLSCNFDKYPLSALFSTLWSAPLTANTTRSAQSRYKPS